VAMMRKTSLFVALLTLVTLILPLMAQDDMENMYLRKAVKDVSAQKWMDWFNYRGLLEPPGRLRPGQFIEECYRQAALAEETGLRLSPEGGHCCGARLPAR